MGAGAGQVWDLWHGEFSWSRSKSIPDPARHNGNYDKKSIHIAFLSKEKQAELDSRKHRAGKVCNCGFIFMGKMQDLIQIDIGLIKAQPDGLNLKRSTCN